MEIPDIVGYGLTRLLKPGSEDSGMNENSLWIMRTGQPSHFGALSQRKQIHNDRNDGQYPIAG